MDGLSLQLYKGATRDAQCSPVTLTRNTIMSNGTHYTAPRHRVDVTIQNHEAMIHDYLVRMGYENPGELTQQVLEGCDLSGGLDGDDYSITQDCFEDLMAEVLSDLFFMTYV